MPSPERIERDSLGEVRVPVGALYGPQTARAAAWSFSGLRMPLPVIHALAHFKAAAARVQCDRGALAADKARAIEQAALEVVDGRHDEHFVLDVFQTGSGTSSNMNVNEVVANRAALLLGATLPSDLVHPNDDVNVGQSSNDVVPSALQLALLLSCRASLMPALERVIADFRQLGSRHWSVVRDGRTHLMRATPIRMGQQFVGYADQLEQQRKRLLQVIDGCRELPLGGTAVGTGVGCASGFATAVCEVVARRCDVEVFETDRHLGRQGNLDAVTWLVAGIAAVGSTLYKQVNDLRWQSAECLSEVELPVMQPGSSIMPGKTNPVVCEAVLMACQQIEACALAVGRANSQGQFELNTMIPLVAMNALQAVDLLGGALDVLSVHCLAGLQVPSDTGDDVLRNPILATGLVPCVGYDAAAAIARRAAAEGSTVHEVAASDTDLDQATLDRLLDPARLAGDFGRPSGCAPGEAAGEAAGDGDGTTA